MVEQVDPPRFEGPLGQLSPKPDSWPGGEPSALRKGRKLHVMKHETDWPSCQFGCLLGANVWKATRARPQRQEGPVISGLLRASHILPKLCRCLPKPSHQRTRYFSPTLHQERETCGKGEKGTSPLCALLVTRWPLSYRSWTWDRIKETASQDKHFLQQPLGRRTPDNAWTWPSLKWCRDAAWSMLNSTPK